jgi:hypothetical protein
MLEDAAPLLGRLRLGISVAFSEVAVDGGLDGAGGVALRLRPLLDKGLPPAAALSMLARAALLASSIFDILANGPSVSITDLPSTRYVATQDLAPLAVIRIPKPGR